MGDSGSDADERRDAAEDAGPPDPVEPSGPVDPSEPGDPSDNTTTEHRHHRPHLPHPEHPVLLETSDDRWEWRRKIRADPHKVRLYRVAVAIAGALLIALGAITGPLPGPGGIPLVLLGLAVWASEFAWAHRLMQWFKKQLHQFRGWSRPRQALAWVIFFVCIGILGYAYMAVIGVPTWLPQSIIDQLDRLPGLG